MGGPGDDMVMSMTATSNAVYAAGLCFSTLPLGNTTLPGGPMFLTKLSDTSPGINQLRLFSLMALAYAVTWALSPALTAKLAPLTWRASSEARNTAIGAISSGGSQGRRMGV